MTDLDTYLVQNFLNAEQCADACGLSIAELDEFIQAQLVPAPAYVVTSDGMLKSYAFGTMVALGSVAGKFFHPSQSVWVDLAKGALVRYGREHAGAALQLQFSEGFQAALADLNITTWRLPDSFSDDGCRLVSGSRESSDVLWEHFLRGTFGLCVAMPVSAASSAWTTALQAKLTHLGGNGARNEFSADQSEPMRTLIAAFAAFAASALTLSPIEYHLGNRKRMLEELPPRIPAL